MIEREIEKPSFILVTGGITDIKATCDPVSGLLPGPCPPNTGFCPPRVICRPATEGCFPNQPCVPNATEPRRPPGQPIPPYPRPPWDR